MWRVPDPESTRSESRLYSFWIQLISQATGVWVYCTPKRTRRPPESLPTPRRRNNRLDGATVENDRKRENIEDAGVMMPGPGGVLA
jgi:hypothetical protein